LQDSADIVFFILNSSILKVFSKVYIQYRHLPSIYIVKAFPYRNCGHGEKDVRGPWGKWGHHECRGRRGARPGWRGKK
jgi:hypothetical protein